MKEEGGKGFARGGVMGQGKSMKLPKTPQTDGLTGGLPDPRSLPNTPQMPPGVPKTIPGMGGSMPKKKWTGGMNPNTPPNPQGQGY